MKSLTHISPEDLASLEKLLQKDKIFGSVKSNWQNGAIHTINIECTLNAYDVKEILNGHRKIL